MRLVARNKFISGIPCNKILDSKGNELSTPLQIEFTSSSPSPIISITYDSNVRCYIIELASSLEASIGDEIILYDSEFTYTTNIAKISNNGLKYRLPINYLLDKDVIITNVLIEKKFKINPAEVNEGVYYTDLGEVLFIADRFNYEELLTLDDVRSTNPILRSNLATEDFELIKLRRAAYNTIMDRLSNYESIIGSSFNFLNGTTLRNMTRIQLLINYAETLPDNAFGKNTKLARHISDLEQLFTSWVKTLQINPDDGSIVKEEKDDLLLLQY